MYILAVITAREHGCYVWRPFYWFACVCIADTDRLTNKVNKHTTVDASVWRQDISIIFSSINVPTLILFAIILFVKCTKSFLYVTTKLCLSFKKFQCCGQSFFFWSDIAHYMPEFSLSCGRFYYSAAALLAMQSTVLATAIPSVCPSVRMTHAAWYPMKIGSLWGSKTLQFFYTNSGWGRHSLPPKICAQSEPPL